MTPLITAAISTLVPNLAQQGLDLLSGLFSGATTKGVEKVADYVEEKTGIQIGDIASNRLSDEQWSELRKFEAEHKAQILAAYVELDANEVERARIVGSDRANARTMQIAVMGKGDQMTQKFIYFYAVLLTLFTFGFVSWASFGHDYAANPESRDMVNIVFGFLMGTALSAVIQFFFGSSLGSKNKGDQLSLLKGDK